MAHEFQRTNVLDGIQYRIQMAILVDYCFFIRLYANQNINISFLIHFGFAVSAKSFDFVTNSVCL